MQNGKDEEFGRAAEYLTKEIGEGPYYLVEQKPRFATTMGGLVVTTSLEVKNTSDTVIPGLYAAGENRRRRHGRRFPIRRQQRLGTDLRQTGRGSDHRSLEIINHEKSLRWDALFFYIQPDKRSNSSRAFPG